MQGLYVGIDLGTTFSLAAIIQDGRPLIIENAIGETLTPSVVSEDEDGSILIGAAALARTTTHPQTTAATFKREMGTSASFQVGGRRLRPEELSALVLRKLAEDVEARTGMTITEAVVTVPAYFGEAQRRATRDACALAGLTVERVINEPTAAALAYGLNHYEEDQRVIVLDLGGGTFDVSVLEILEGVIEIQGSAGDTRLGGEDFVNALVEELAPEVRAARGLVAEEPRQRAQLRAACERLKRELSEAERAPLYLPATDSAKAFERVVSREEAEAWWEPLVVRLRSPIRAALADAGVSPEEIDVALLVGGATRMPVFRRLAASLFGGRVRHELPPDEAVAMGAAVQAALKADQKDVQDLVVTDIAPFTMGISVQRRVGHRDLQGVFSPIIERGTVLPASREDEFYTIDDDQRSLLLEVYQGENTMCRDNHRLGHYSLDNLPPAKSGEVPIRVRFTYDLNGMLEVEATVGAHGRHGERVETFVVEREPGVMTPEQIKRARAAMARVKFHPRDALPNRVAIERAEELHTRLLGDARGYLRAQIVDFRGALESQDIPRISGQREELIALCRYLAEATNT